MGHLRDVPSVLYPECFRASASRKAKLPSMNSSCSGRLVAPGSKNLSFSAEGNLTACAEEMPPPLGTTYMWYPVRPAEMLNGPSFLTACTPSSRFRCVSRWWGHCGSSGQTRCDKNNQAFRTPSAGGVAHTTSNAQEELELIPSVDASGGHFLRGLVKPLGKCPLPNAKWCKGSPNRDAVKKAQQKPGFRPENDARTPVVTEL